MSLKRIAEGFSGGRKSCPEKEIHQMIPLKKAGKPLSPGMEEKKDEESPDLCGRFLWLVFKVTKPFSWQNSRTGHPWHWRELWRGQQAVKARHRRVTIAESAMVESDMCKAKVTLFWLYNVEICWRQFLVVLLLLLQIWWYAQPNLMVWPRFTIKGIQKIFLWGFAGLILKLHWLKKEIPNNITFMPHIIFCRILRRKEFYQEIKTIHMIIYIPLIT